MNRQQITDVFFTKEAFAQHVRALKQERAKEYGMTVEEWDRAIMEGKTVEHLNRSGSEDLNIKKLEL